MQCGNAPQANDSLVLALVSRVMHMRATCYEGSTGASLLSEKEQPDEPSGEHLATHDERTRGVEKINRKMV
jgi:hypothetical protein